MVPYRYDPEHIAPANRAPRCQHIRANGQRCKAPARRRHHYCRFHENIWLCQHRAIRVSFIEDPTGLQLALMEVLRQLEGPRPDYRACGLKLYALQIACSNIKALRTENEELPPQPAQAQPARPAPRKNGAARTEPQKGESLAAMLLRLLRQPETADDQEGADAAESSVPAAEAPGKFPPRSSDAGDPAGDTHAAREPRPSTSPSCRIESQSHDYDPLSRSRSAHL
jgi:hypothetical protein